MIFRILEEKEGKKNGRYEEPADDAGDDVYDDSGRNGDEPFGRSQGLPDNGTIPAFSARITGDVLLYSILV